MQSIPSVTFIVSYRITKCIREITSGSVMCGYLTTNELIYDGMNTLYNTNFATSNTGVDILKSYRWGYFTK